MSETPEWMKPSEGLRRAASLTNTPSMRPVCPKCPHRHAKGDYCGELVVDRKSFTGGVRSCPCRTGTEA